MIRFYKISTVRYYNIYHLTIQSITAAVRYSMQVVRVNPISFRINLFHLKNVCSKGKVASIYIFVECYILNCGFNNRIVSLICLISVNYLNLYEVLRSCIIGCQFIGWSTIEFILWLIADFLLYKLISWTDWVLLYPSLLLI